MNYTEIEKIETQEQVGELLEYIAQENKEKFTLVKCAEELNELALVLLQYVNKKGEHRPTKQEIIDEIGDAQMRTFMVLHKLDISVEEVDERCLYKANKYLGYLKQGLYIKGI